MPERARDTHPLSDSGITRKAEREQRRRGREALRAARAQLDAMRGSGPAGESPAAADAALRRNRQRAPGLNPGAGAALGGRQPVADPFMRQASPVTAPLDLSPAFQQTAGYVAMGPWQRGQGATTQGVAPFVDDTPTLPGTTPIRVNAAAAPEQPAPREPTPAERRLQESLSGVSTRLDRLSSIMVRNVPAPGGVAPLIWGLLILLAAIVPVSAGGGTRLKLLWETLTGDAFLPGVAYDGVIPGQSGAPIPADIGVAQQQQAAQRGLLDTALFGPITGPIAAQFGIGGMGGTQGHIPTSLPLGKWGETAAGPMRIPGRAPYHGGHHARVVSAQTSGQHDGGNGGTASSVQPIAFPRRRAGLGGVP